MTDTIAIDYINQKKKKILFQHETNTIHYQDKCNSYSG